jgi:hypothetical protein
MSRGYEPSDLPPRGAAAAIGGLFALLIIAGLAAALVLRFIAHREPPAPHTVFAKPPPPRLEVTPEADRLRLESAAKARLRGGADGPSIEQAMQQVARAGWRDDAAGEAQ